MKSLLHKSHIQLIGCIVIMLVLVTPLFYLLTKNYYSEEMIENINRLSNGGSVNPSDIEEDIVEGMVIQFVIIFAILSLSLILVMRIFTRRLWKPFDNTLLKIEQFNLDQSDIPDFVKSDITEFERLNHSVKKLMCKDKKTYKAQKEFTENASHELQTPIAIIKSKLDLLMQEELTESQASLVSDMYNTCSNLSRLNKNLLMLAKIENSQFDTTENIEFVSFFNGRMGIYSELNTDSKILLNEDATTIPLSVNVPLLESLLDNLIVNAIRHKPEGTDITISINQKSFSVINQSRDNTPIPDDILFKRFNKGKNRDNGNGLGLSIAKAICDYHDWRIDYKFDNGNHCFTVTFNA